MTWLKDGTLACDTCKLVFEYPGPRVIVLNAARAHGWHCYTGPSLSGKLLDTHLCETCVQTPRKRLPKSEALDGQDPLF
jgi:hypothetical protein